MPRITASSVAEHVARQRERIFDTAIGLFIDRGYEAVSLGDIADEVGLARNSLYRYYSSKAEILVIWFRAELERQIAESATVMARQGTPMERVAAWVDAQLDYAGRPEHALAATIPRIEPDLAPAVREELAEGRGRLFAPLRGALAAEGIEDEPTASAIIELIRGLVFAAALQETDNGGPGPVLRDRLHRAIAALVTPD